MNLAKLIQQGRMLPIHCKGLDGFTYVVAFKRKARSKKGHHLPDFLRTPLKCDREPTSEDLKLILMMEAKDIPARALAVFLEVTQPKVPAAVSDEEAQKAANEDTH